MEQSQKAAMGSYAES